MAWRSARTETRGFSLVEALIGVVAGTMVLVLAFSVLRSGSRIQARAESKLAATAEAELVFRKLGRDLAAALKPPHLAGGVLTLVTPRSAAVTWSFTAAAPGQGSAIERSDDSGARARHLIGALVSFELKQVGADARAPIALSLTTQGVHDAAAAEFRETFFLRGVESDAAWNPLQDAQRGAPL